MSAPASGGSPRRWRCGGAAGTSASSSRRRRRASWALRWRWRPTRSRRSASSGLRDAIVSRGRRGAQAFEVRHVDGRVAQARRLARPRRPIRGRAASRTARHAARRRRRRRARPRRACDPGVLRFWRRISVLDSVARIRRSGLEPLSAAEVIVGADGVGSVIRQALHPGEPPPRASGYRALRGVTHDAGDALGGADAAVYLGDGVEIGCARASASAVYWYVSLVDEFVGADIVATLERCMHGLDPRVGAIAHAARREDIRLDRLCMPCIRCTDGDAGASPFSATPPIPCCRTRRRGRRWPSRTPSRWDSRWRAATASTPRCAATRTCARRGRDRSSRAACASRR